MRWLPNRPTWAAWEGCIVTAVFYEGGDPIIHERVHAPVVKMDTIKIVYEDDVLVINGYCCTKIANLLLPDYRSIVGAAREEQRQHEAEQHVPKGDRLEVL